MQFYMKIEQFSNGTLVNKGVTCFDADDLAEALSKSTRMIEEYPDTLRGGRQTIDREERITIGPVLEQHVE